MNGNRNVQMPDEIVIEKHDGHVVRSGRRLVDRSKIGKVKIASSSGEKLPNQYTGHTFKNKNKRFNLDGHKLIYHLARVLAWQRGERIAPIHIDIGLTKFCNVGCIYCIGVTQGMEKGTMIKADALFRFIEDCSRLGVRSVAFIGDGEPTLNPALYDAVVKADHLGVDTGMATNGLLFDMDRAHDVLKNSSFVRITLGSAEASSFSKIHQRSGANFEKLVEKMKVMVDIRNSNNYKCSLGIQMVLIPENFDQVIKLANLGADIGMDYLQIKQCSDSEYRELGVDYDAYENVVEYLRTAETFSSDKYTVQVKWNKININDDTTVYHKGVRKYDICYGTPFLGQVSGNGKVYPCGPFFGKERFCMGDIHTQSYYDIVNGDRYWDVQKDIVDNVDVHCDCTIGCRQDYINKFLSDLKNPPEHINFI